MKARKVMNWTKENELALLRAHRKFEALEQKLPSREYCNRVFSYMQREQGVVFPSDYQRRRNFCINLKAKIRDVAARYGDEDDSTCDDSERDVSSSPACVAAAEVSWVNIDAAPQPCGSFEKTLSTVNACLEQISSSIAAYNGKDHTWHSAILEQQKSNGRTLETVLDSCHEQIINQRRLARNQRAISEQLASLAARLGSIEHALLSEPVRAQSSLTQLIDDDDTEDDRFLERIAVD